MRPESELWAEGELANIQINESQVFTEYKDHFRWTLKWDNKTQTEKENAHTTPLMHAIAQSLKIRRRGSTENTAQKEHTSMGAGRWNSTRQHIRASTSFNNQKEKIIYPVKNSSSASNSDEGYNSILMPAWGELCLQWAPWSTSLWRWLCHQEQKLWWQFGLIQRNEDSQKWWVKQTSTRLEFKTICRLGQN